MSVPIRGCRLPTKLSLIGQANCELHGCGGCLGVGAEGKNISRFDIQQWIAGKWDVDTVGDDVAAGYCSSALRLKDEDNQCCLGLAEKKKLPFAIGAEEFIIITANALESSISLSFQTMTPSLSFLKNGTKPQQSNLNSKKINKNCFCRPQSTEGRKSCATLWNKDKCPVSCKILWRLPETARGSIPAVTAPGMRKVSPLFTLIWFTFKEMFLSNRKFQWMRPLWCHTGNWQLIENSLHHVFVLFIFFKHLSFKQTCFTMQICRDPRMASALAGCRTCVWECFMPLAELKCFFFWNNNWDEDFFKMFKHKSWRMQNCPHGCRRCVVNYGCCSIHVIFEWVSALCGFIGSCTQNLHKVRWDEDSREACQSRIWGETMVIVVWSECSDDENALDERTPLGAWSENVICGHELVMTCESDGLKNVVVQINWRWNILHFFV